jgi:hypothetical protein
MLFKHLVLSFLIVYIQVIHTYSQDPFQDTKIEINFSIMFLEFWKNQIRKKI